MERTRNWGKVSENQLVTDFSGRPFMSRGRLTVGKAINIGPGGWRNMVGTES